MFLENNGECWKPSTLPEDKQQILHRVRDKEAILAGKGVVWISQSSHPTSSLLSG